MLLQDMIADGLKRSVGKPFDYTKATGFNLGAGKHPIPGHKSLDLPSWNGESGSLPARDNAVESIVAIHFFEHLAPPHVVKLLREVERVLKPGGVLTLVVPHSSSPIAFDDIDHKSFWTEDTLRNLFRSEFYGKHGEWKLERPFFSFIAGVSARNLCLFQQVAKS